MSDLVIPVPSAGEQSKPGHDVDASRAVDPSRSAAAGHEPEASARTEPHSLHAQFSHRRRSALDASSTQAVSSFQAAHPGLRALMVDDETPAAGRGIVSQAILSHMLALQRLGYMVSFAATSMQIHDAQAVEALERQGIVCCRAPYYASVEDVLRSQAHSFDVIYLHRVSNASNYLSLAREHNPQARILYGVAGLSHLQMARQARIEHRSELLAEGRRLRLAECTAAWSADAVLTHSAYEATLMDRAVPGANIHVVPWAIPTRPATTPFSERAGVAFIGDYAQASDVDAAHFLADEVMPLVWATNPAIPCLLAGSRMPDSILRLEGPGLSIVGQGPDLAEVFNQVRLTAAPLRYGAGVQGKVLASLAAGIPCVVSPVAAEGINLPSSLAGCSGATAAELAARIVRLHTDGNANRQAAQAGLAVIRNRFDEAKVADALQGAIEGRTRQVAAAG